MSAELVVEGAGDLGAGVVSAKAKDGKAQPLDTLGWTGALSTFRPFLSYNELGSLLEDGPSALYDALYDALSTAAAGWAQRRWRSARAWPVAS